MKPASLIAVILLSVVALAHLLRLLLRAEITVAGEVIPMWVSLIGCVVPGTVALMLWRESRQ